MLNLHLSEVWKFQNCRLNYSFLALRHFAGVSTTLRTGAVYSNNVPDTDVKCVDLGLCRRYYALNFFAHFQKFSRGQ